MYLIQCLRFIGVSNRILILTIPVGIYFVPGVVRLIDKNLDKKMATFYIRLLQLCSTIYSTS